MAFSQKLSHSLFIDRNVVAAIVCTEIQQMKRAKVIFFPVPKSTVQCSLPPPQLSSNTIYYIYVGVHYSTLDVRTPNSICKDQHDLQTSTVPYFFLTFLLEVFINHNGCRTWSQAVVMRAIHLNLHARQGQLSTGRPVKTCTKSSRTANIKEPGGNASNGFCTFAIVIVSGDESVTWPY